jgi:hypothetical protein
MTARARRMTPMPMRFPMRRCLGVGGRRRCCEEFGASLLLDQPALGDSDTAASDFRTSIRQFSIKLISFYA